MLRTIVAGSQGETGSITPAVAAVDFPRKSNRGFQAPGQLSKHDIDAIASQLAIKLKGPSPIQGRVQGGQRTVRNRRTTDGRPICNFCGKPGHMRTCDARWWQCGITDPRIPPRQNSYRGCPVAQGPYPHTFHNSGADMTAGQGQPEREPFNQQQSN